MVRAKQGFTTEPRDSDGRLDETVEKVSDIAYVRTRYLTLFQQFHLNTQPCCPRSPQQPHKLITKTLIEVVFTFSSASGFGRPNCSFGNKLVL